MTEITLEAQRRDTTGKRMAKRLRREGMVPAVLYGLKEKAEIIQVNARVAGKLVNQLHGSERLISLSVADAPGAQGVKRSVLLKEVQATPVGARLLHIDFQEVDVTQTVHVTVEVRPVGKAKGEVFGGLVQQVTREVMVECLPTNIPEHLDLDVSPLEIGHSLHVSDLVLPEGVTALTTPEETLVVVAAPRLGAGGEGEEGEEEGAEGAVPSGAGAESGADES